MSFKDEADNIYKRYPIRDAISSCSSFILWMQHTVINLGCYLFPQVLPKFFFFLFWFTEIHFLKAFYAFWFVWGFLFFFFYHQSVWKTVFPCFFFTWMWDHKWPFPRISKWYPAGNVLPRWTEFHWRNIQFCDIPIWTMDFVFIGQLWVNSSVIAEIKGPYHHKNFTIFQPQEWSIFQGGNQSLYIFWIASVLLGKCFLFPVQQTASCPPLVWCGCQMQWLLLTYFVLCFHLIPLPILKEKKWHLFSPPQNIVLRWETKWKQKKVVCVCYCRSSPKSPAIEGSECVLG